MSASMLARGPRFWRDRRRCDCGDGEHPATARSKPTEELTEEDVRSATRRWRDFLRTSSSSRPISRYAPARRSPVYALAYTVGFALFGALLTLALVPVSHGAPPRPAFRNKPPNVGEPTSRWGTTEPRPISHGAAFVAWGHNAPGSRLPDLDEGALWLWSAIGLRRCRERDGQRASAHRENFRKSIYHDATRREDAAVDAWSFST
jgi:hypothetical protein